MMNVAMLLETVAEIFPDRVAVSTEKGKATYAQLLTGARARGSGLKDVLEGRPLAFVGTNQLAFPLLIFAAAYAGVPIVPLNYRVKQAEYEHYFAIADPGLVVSDVRYHDLLRRAAAAVRPSLEIVQLRDLAASGEPPAIATDPTESAVLLFTSGTSSAPKLVHLTHANLVGYVLETVQCGSADECEAALLATPPYHVAAIANVLTSVFRGRRLILMEKFDASSWLEVVSAERVTHAMVVPTMLARILDALETDPELAPSSLVNLSYGGSRPPLGLVERALHLLPVHVGLVNAFGLTETSSTVAMLGPDDHRAAFMSDDPAVRARLHSIGHAIPGVEVRIDVEDHEAQAGEIGELCIKGPQVSKGYVVGNLRVDQDGWLRTGDLGHVDDAGFIFIDGRIDDLIIRGGENIDPLEIEAVLLGHPAVEEALVVGIPDEEWGEAVAALLVGAPPESDDVIVEWVRSQLASYKVPRRVLWVDELPRNDLGKLVRRRAREIISS